MRLINPAASLYAFGMQPAPPCPMCGGESCCPPHQCKAFGSSVRCVSSSTYATPGASQAAGARFLSGMRAVAYANPQRVHNQHVGELEVKKKLKARQRAIAAATAGSLAAILKQLTNPNPCSVEDRDAMCCGRL